MIDIKDLISNLNKATVLEVKHDKNSFIIVSVHIPTNDLDDIYSVYSNGGGFILHWEGMEMITKDICLLKEDFSLLYIEVLKELMKREGEGSYLAIEYKREMKLVWDFQQSKIDTLISHINEALDGF